MKAEYKQMLQPFLDAGYTLKRRRNNAHIAVVSPDGRIATMIPSTPGDRRSLQNTRAELRRDLRIYQQNHATRVESNSLREN